MKRFAVICFLFTVGLSFSALYAHDSATFLTSPTPQGLPTVAPTVATTAPTVAPTAVPTIATAAPTSAPAATFPPAVTTLPASGQHADWRPVMLLGALAFLAMSGFSLWHIRSRGKHE